MALAATDKPPSKNWMENFKALSCFVRKHKHCRPSLGADTEAVQFLARWALEQRRHYRWFCSGEYSTMTLEKVALLQGIGFPFEVKRGETTSSLPSSTDDNVDVEMTPVQAPPTKPVVPTKPDPIPKAVNLNNTIPTKPVLEKPESDSAESSWFASFSRLCAYKRTHGHCCVTSRDLALQSWALSQRKDHKAGTMDAYHRKLLLSIGFRFPTRSVFVSEENLDVSEEVNALKRKSVRPTSAWAPVNKKSKSLVLEPKKDEASMTETKPAPVKKAIVVTKVGKVKEVSKTLIKHPAGEMMVAPLAPKVAQNGARPSALEIWNGPPDDYLREGGWPPGWIKRVFQRASGKTKGATDDYWYPPDNGRRLRSMVEVRRYFGLPESYGTKTNSPKKKKKKESSVRGLTPKMAAQTVMGKSVKRSAAAVPQRNKQVVKKSRTRLTEADLSMIRAHVPK